MSTLNAPIQSLELVCCFCFKAVMVWKVISKSDLTYFCIFSIRPTSLLQPKDDLFSLPTPPTDSTAMQCSPVTSQQDSQPFLDFRLCPTVQLRWELKQHAGANSVQHSLFEGESELRNYYSIDIHRIR